MGLRLRRLREGQPRQPRAGRPHCDRGVRGMGEGRWHGRHRRCRRPRDRLGREDDERSPSLRTWWSCSGSGNLGRRRAHGRLRSRQAGRGVRVGDHEADRHDEADSHRTGRLRRPDGFREPVLFAGRQATRWLCDRQEVAEQPRQTHRQGPRVGTVRRTEGTTPAQARLHQAVAEGQLHELRRPQQRLDSHACGGRRCGRLSQHQGRGDPGEDRPGEVHHRRNETLLRPQVARAGTVRTHESLWSPEFPPEPSRSPCTIRLCRKAMPRFRRAVSCSISPRAGKSSPSFARNRSSFGTP